MAHFRGTLDGTRGVATRLGTKNIGMTAVVHGWDRGVVVEAGNEGGMDFFRVYRDGGSNDPQDRALVAIIHEDGTVVSAADGSVMAV